MADGTSASNPNDICPMIRMAKYDRPVQSACLYSGLALKTCGHRELITFPIDSNGYSPITHLTMNV